MHNPRRLKGALFLPSSYTSLCCWFVVSIFLLFPLLGIEMVEPPIEGINTYYGLAVGIPYEQYGCTGRRKDQCALVLCLQFPSLTVSFL